MNYSSINEFTSSLMPILKVERKQIDKNHNGYSLISGFLDVDGNFNQTPLSVFYVQIISIYQEEKYEVWPKQFVKLDIRIFSKDFTANRLESVEFQRNDNIVLDFMIFNKVINTINEYVYHDYSLSELKIENIKEDNLKVYSNKILIEPVNKLEFKLFENSQYGGRKRDFFWKELEINKLPKDRYIKQLIRDCLMQQNGKDFIDNGQTAILEFDWESEEVSASCQRKEIMSAENQIEIIRDNLKMDLATSYDPLHHKLSRLKEG